METKKEEMTMLLRELQDLQMWLFNSLHEISLDINFNVFENNIAIYGHVGFFSDFSMNERVCIYSFDSYEENRKQLNYFIEYVKKLSEYGNNKRGNGTTNA